MSALTRGTVASNNYVWDLNLLKWVAMQQPTIEGETIDVAVSGSLGQSDTEARAFQSATGTITASGQSVVLALNGAKGASADFVDSSFNGTFKFYARVDSQYIETQAFNIYGATGGEPISNPLHNGVSGNRIWHIVTPPGATHVKVNAESGNSGSCAVVIKANEGNVLADYAICPSEESDSGRPVAGMLFMVRQGTKGVRSLRTVQQRYEAAGSSLPSLLTMARTVTCNVLSVDTTVNDTNSSVQLLAQNTQRLGGTITNTSSAVLYVKLSGGNDASATSFVKRLSQWETYVIPEYWIGAICGVWATDPNDGVAVIQEHREV